jgi:hypothetical protein
LALAVMLVLALAAPVVRCQEEDDEDDVQAAAAPANQLEAIKAMATEYVNKAIEVGTPYVEQAQELATEYAGLASKYLKDALDKLGVNKKAEAEL